MTLLDTDTKWLEDLWADIPCEIFFHEELGHTAPAKYALDFWCPKCRCPKVRFLACQECVDAFEGGLLIECHCYYSDHALKFFTIVSEI